MSAPSPFQVANAIGTNLSGVFRESKDENAIGRILEEASKTGNPQDFQGAIGKILSQVSPERQGVALNYLQNQYQIIQQKQEKEKQRRSLEDEGLNPDSPVWLQTEKFKANAKNQRLGNYGLGPASPSPQIGQIQPSITAPSAPMQAGGQPEIQPQIQNPFGNKTYDQLILMSGAPDKEVSEPAKQEISRRDNNRKEELDFHRESQKYDEELTKQTKIAKNQVESIGRIEEALASGNVKPISMANIFKGFGDIGNKISNALINKDQATLLASIPQLLEGWKEVFGVRLSDADLKVLQDKLPDIGKTPEANRSILKVLSKYADMTLLRDQIGKTIKKENRGLRPLGYTDMIEERFDNMVKPVKMINPNNGNVFDVPAYKVSDAIQSGATLANE